jgi:hypothetical protein
MTGQIAGRILPIRVKALIVEVAEQYNVVPASLFDRRGPLVNTVVKRIIIGRLSKQGIADTVIARFLGMHHTSVFHLRRQAQERINLAREINWEIPVPDLSGEWAI